MKKVLIVDDDPNIAASLEIRFRASGYATLIAHDALQATRLAVQNKPDLVVLDISMPAGNGLEVAANLQRLPETNSVPIIFITASKDPQLREKIMDLHVAGFFEKPYDSEELLTLARYAMDHTASSPVEKKPALWNKTPAEKILIVEDDPKIAKALALRMKAAGYQTMLALDALQGLNTAFRTPPDLMLMDISMPAGNGLDLARKIQTILPEPPAIIFLTASKKPELREKALELGAAGFFEKPYEAEELMRAVEVALEKRQEPRFAR